MRKSVLALAAVTAVLATPMLAAAQDAGHWIVRARAVHLDPANGNSGDLQAALSSVTGVPTEAAINSRTIPEVDISYFFTPNIAAELVLTYPQKQDVSLKTAAGSAKIGSFKHLPPTLTAQYHFTGFGKLRPYLGAGLNYTNISDVQFDPALSALQLNLKRNSFGLAAQAGVDYELGGGWLLNLDVKKVQIRTDVTAAGTKLGTFKVDPLLVGLGIGKRF
ncbi:MULTISPECIES: OmpW family outer membrane protein [Ramlibacter]|uniref:OmpW family protein n=1 Tax=Ramlibacter aquaticus TaxID=2780094 RepID=A0ABR9SAA2_9BURK|nr:MULTISPECIES: OmpW family outer membrane protein [Ramlibacter]MBE7939149.1 OmpW family protein [Ramlibacter aquaticus]